MVEVVLAQREALAAQAANAQLGRRVGELAQRVQELEGRQPPTKPPGLAGNKIEPARPAPAPRPRKKRAANRARARMAPTARVVHALPHCPDCGRALAGGSVKWTREVIELPPPPPVTVTEHTYLARHCPHCRRD